MTDYESANEVIHEVVRDIDPDLVENTSDLEELMELLLFLGFPTI